MKSFFGILLLPLAMLRWDALSHEQMRRHVWIQFVAQGWILSAKQTLLRPPYRDLQVREDLNAGVYGKWKIRSELPFAGLTVQVV